MTTKTIVDITSLAVAVSGGILAVANQITAIPALPGWLTNSWPAVLAVATLIDRIGNIVLKNMPPAAVVGIPATPSEGYGPVNPAPVAGLPTAPFRAPLGQPQVPK